MKQTSLLKTSFILFLFSSCVIACCSIVLTQCVVCLACDARTHIHYWQIVLFTNHQTKLSKIFRNKLNFSAFIICSAFSAEMFINFWNVSIFLPNNLRFIECYYCFVDTEKSICSVFYLKFIEMIVMHDWHHAPVTAIMV